MAGASALYLLGVRFMHGMSASIHILFCLIFLIILYSIRVKTSSTVYDCTKYLVYEKVIIAYKNH